MATGRFETVGGSHSWPALFLLGSRGPDHGNFEVPALPDLFTSCSLSPEVSSSYLQLSTSRDGARWSPRWSSKASSSRGSHPGPWWPRTPEDRSRGGHRGGPVTNGCLCLARARRLPRRGSPSRSLSLALSSPALGAGSMRRHSHEDKLGSPHSQRGSQHQPEGVWKQVPHQPGSPTRQPSWPTARAQLLPGPP